MEAASNPQPTRSEVLERESRFSRPAGIAAIVGVLLLVAATGLQQTAANLQDASAAERLREYAAHGGALLLSDIVGFFGMSLLAVPLYFLFKAAQGRAPAMRAPLAILAVLGPLLLATQGVVRSAGFGSAGDEFAAAEKAAPAKSVQAKEGSGSGTQPKGSESSKGDGKKGADGGSKGNANTDSDGKEKTSPADKRAERIIDDTSLIQASIFLQLIGALSFVIAMVYTSLWALRTGLLTRFWGTLGMALGAALVILPFALLGLLTWFAVVGLLLLGLWPGGRPPAWASGTAMPWPKPGRAADTEQTPPDRLEGTAREKEPSDSGESGRELPPAQDQPPERRD